jgi:homoserine kinase type II
MADTVHWVFHWRDEDERTLKTIGHFSTRQRALEAIETVRSAPGFVDYPDGFGIDEVALDVVCWPDGFGTGE